MTLKEKLKGLNNELKVRGTALIAKATENNQHFVETDLAGIAFDLKDADMAEPEIYDLYLSSSELHAEIVMKGIHLLFEEIRNSTEIDLMEISDAFDILQQIFGTTALNAAAYALYLEKAGKLVIDK